MPSAYSAGGLESNSRLVVGLAVTLLILPFVIGFITACSIINQRIDIECEGGAGHNRNIEFTVGFNLGAAPDPNQNTPRNVRIAFLVPTTWSGFSTSTLTTSRAPFVYNGTTLSWSSSATAAARAEVRYSGHPASFAWVGFQSNQVTPDPNESSIHFLQTLSISSAPQADLAGASTISFFVGDSAADDEGVFAMPSECPGTFSLHTQEIPTLSQWSLLILAVFLVSAGTLLVRKRANAPS